MAYQVLQSKARRYISKDENETRACKARYVHVGGCDEVSSQLAENLGEQKAGRLFCRALWLQRPEFMVTQTTFAYDVLLSLRRVTSDLS